ncbi:MAG: gamma-butyrobetaine hydroxylase-like domain-containing protein [Endozoicomonas sp.]
MNRKVPKALKLHKRSKDLELSYVDATGHEESYRVSCELLRVCSPSAEVRGHGKPIMQTGKKHVLITAMETVGNYAIKLVFDDGHDSGLYDWGYLYDLCTNQESHWEEYLRQLHAAGESRDPQASVVRLV